MRYLPAFDPEAFGGLWSDQNKRYYTPNTSANAKLYLCVCDTHTHTHTYMHALIMIKSSRMFISSLFLITNAVQARVFFVSQREFALRTSSKSLGKTRERNKTNTQVHCNGKENCPATASLCAFYFCPSCWAILTFLVWWTRFRSGIIRISGRRVSRGGQELIRGEGLGLWLDSRCSAPSPRSGRSFNFFYRHVSKAPSPLERFCRGY